jgi:acetylornithine/succinyldiaminopimelate/putrescine aminotransferase
LGQKQVRGVGLMQAVVLERPQAKEVQLRCLEQGVIVNAVDDNTIRLVPPLILNEAQVERGIAGLRSALA